MNSPRLILLMIGPALLAACGVVTPPPPAPAPQPASPPMSQAAPPATKAAAPAKPSPSTAKAAPAPAKPAPVIVAAKPAPIDLKSLEQKLRDSKAIGVMTKLSLKNQVDDLVAQFKAFHAGRQPPTLVQLRQPYELLLMKVLSLVQDQDPALARALHDSRDSIWGVLADRNKFLSEVNT